MLRKLKPNCSRRRIVLAIVPLAIIGLLGAAFWGQPAAVVAASKPTYKISVDVWNYCGKPCRVRISTGNGTTVLDTTEKFKLQTGRKLEVTYNSGSYMTRFEFIPDGGTPFTQTPTVPNQFKCFKWKWTAEINKTSNPRKVTGSFHHAYQCP